jgi:hypothetical protein
MRMVRGYGVADLGQVRPRLLGPLGTVAREARALVERIRALVRREGPDRCLRAAALAERVERRGHQVASDALAPAAGRHKEAADLANGRVRVVVAALAGGAEAEKFAVVLREQQRNGGVLDQGGPTVGVWLRERVPGRQQLREGSARRLVPHARPGRLVGPLCRADVQRLPPAMAGRITIVSLSETPVSSPWSTRTSSSLR